ncbi:SLAM family member 9-like isoform X1 [Ranitomeya imitator]|uniref:SLAM family member 9-like isoform X1 n=1 Tax=Ranitomeya imitator TaxID=111125 RepID=UPI0037E7F4AD
MLLPLLLMFLLNACVVCDESCTQEKEPGPEGGEVVLRVHQTGIRLINWILLPKGDVIVTVKPGQSYDDKDVLPQYRGRVSSLFNGSLQISNLSPQDQRIYKADLRTNDDKTFCELFNLTVYERLSETDIKINHSLIGNDSCSLSLLCTVDKRDVTVTWSQVHRGPINVIQGVLYVLPSDVNVTYICTARNPVSNISKTVIPGDYCKKDPKVPVKKSELPWILGSAFTACVIIVLFVIYKKLAKGKSKKNEVSTTYGQVGEIPLHEENLYHERQKEQQSLTVYSEVQHAKKTNSQKKAAENKPNSLETVYSTVQLTKENQQNGTCAQSAGPSNHSNR